MSAWPEPLPLLLAGPIVRRVEPRLVSVWVATRDACRVELSIHAGIVGSTTTRALFAGTAPLFPPVTAPTLRVGAKLHVLCVVADNVALVPDQIYSYNVTFHTAAGTEDLNSLGLLNNHESGEPPNLPLGYDDAVLPSFTLPPSTLENLRLTHGSCRRAGAAGPDALAFLDDLIAAHRNEASARPHQFFMTGDQIYADDVPKPLLPLCTTLGHYVVSGVPPDPPTGADPLPPGRYTSVDPLEHLETSYRGRLPATHANFTSVWRKGLCEIEGKLTTTDFESHLLSFGEFCGMYLLTFSSAVWPVHAPWVGQATSVVDDPPPTSPLISGGTGTPPVTTPTAADKAAKQDSYDDQAKVLEELRTVLPRVRRALANVPTYMILDDHEVTDDWNVTQRWVADVTGAPLGRAVLRNGLASYAVFQAWGSDPRYFAADAGGGSVLAQIERLFPAGAVKPPVAAAVDELDRLFGLRGQPSQVRWDWTVDGPRHRVVAIDARTRRAFVGPDNLPLIVPPIELERQIPEGPAPAGVDVLVVLAPSPIVGIPLRDDFVQPAVVRFLDIVYEAKKDNPNATVRPGYLDKDFESWFVSPQTLEGVLARLAGYARVVVLSGDVHHASSAVLSYWRKGHPTPTRLANFTSSGLKNHAPGFIGGTVKIVALSERAWHVFTPFERLVWNEEFPRPIELPSHQAVPRALRSKLRTAPVVVPTLGWPPGATLQREPDAAWRLRVVRDERPVSELPPAARTFAAVADVTPADGIAAYSVAAQRHQRALATEGLTRTAVFEHNLGMVTFARELEDAPPADPPTGDLVLVPAQEVLVARHTLFTIHPLAQPPDAADAYTVHRVVLDPFPPEDPPTLSTEVA